MGLIVKKEMPKGCLLGMWEISEDMATLLPMVKLEPFEKTRLEGFKNYNRKLEFLSVRILLKELAGENAIIIYDKTNKPYLKDNSFQISISHSHKLTSVLLSKTKRVGIDLEFMSHRIENISDKFIHPMEIINSDPDLRKYHMYIHWCAKEALYKICDKIELNFKKHLFIEPFEVAEKGNIKGFVHSDKKHNEFNMHYFKMDNYVIVLCCKPIEE
ncbi:MAG: 4'-phosphopantetheinyl transferase superfamily protein [Bacteroidales bacterium]|nr:4'-phosphopantetheinyl transferase superfamily protein [Bacteroidales bacterium]